MKGLLHEMELMSDTARIIKNLGLDKPWAYRKTAILLKVNSNKMTSKDILLHTEISVSVIIQEASS